MAPLRAAASDDAIRAMVPAKRLWTLPHVFHTFGVA
jgi:hypothetical protein